MDCCTERPTEDSEELDDWGMMNSMLVSWIFNTIEPTLRSTITYVDDARELWIDLQQRFYVGNGPRIQQLQFQTAMCRQDGQPVVTYYGRLKKLMSFYETVDTSTGGGACASISYGFG